MTWALPVLSIVLMVYLWLTSSPYLIYSIILFVILVTGIRIIYQYERALKFRLGKFVRLHGPGLN